MRMQAGTPTNPAVTLRVRRVTADDAEPLRTFYSRLSDQTRRLRFLGFVPALGRSNARSFCTPDHEHDEGFVAVDERDDRILGHICLVPDGRGGTELAIAVEDASQGQGIGRRLFEAAFRWGQEHHLDRFTATAFADNTAMIRLALAAPCQAIVSPMGAGIVHIEIPLHPVQDRREGDRP